MELNLDEKQLFRFLKVAATIVTIHVLMFPIIASAAVEAASSEISTTSSLPLRPQRKSYRWIARVDTKNGLAYSKEITSNIIAPKWNPSQTMMKQQNADRRERQRESTRRTFQTYPEWMCRASVSFGLIQAVPRRPLQTGCYDIRTRWGNINVLSFGQPRCRVTVRKVNPTHTATDDTVMLPMLGGLLTAGKRIGNKGSLIFTLTTTVTKETSDSNTHQMIVTEIQNYQSRFCGGDIDERLPSTIRARFYLMTQSVVHAYVMWRFHNHVIQTTTNRNCR